MGPDPPPFFFCPPMKHCLYFEMMWIEIKHKCIKVKSEYFEGMNLSLLSYHVSILISNSMLTSKHLRTSLLLMMNVFPIQNLSLNCKTVFGLMYQN